MDIQKWAMKKYTVTLSESNTTRAQSEWRYIKIINKKKKKISFFNFLNAALEMSKQVTPLERMAS